jgi:hypothetical protein
MTLETVKADVVERQGRDVLVAYVEAQNRTNNWIGSSIFAVLLSLC